MLMFLPSLSQECPTAAHAYINLIDYFAKQVDTTAREMAPEHPRVQAPVADAMITPKGKRRADEDFKDYAAASLREDRPCSAAKLARVTGAVTSRGAANWELVAAKEQHVASVEALT